MATLFNSIPIGEFFVDFVEAKNFVITFSQIFLVKRRHFLTLFILTSFSLTLLKWQIWNFVISFSQIFLVKRRHFLTRFRLTSFSLTESTIYTNNFNTLSVHEFFYRLCAAMKNFVKLFSEICLNVKIHFLQISFWLLTFFKFRKLYNSVAKMIF